MKLEDLSKNTIKKIWAVIVNMPHIEPLRKMTEEANTEEEILKKLETIK